MQESTPLSREQLEHLGFSTTESFIFKIRQAVEVLNFKYPIADQDSNDGAYQGQFVLPIGNNEYSPTSKKMDSVEAVIDYLLTIPRAIPIDGHTYSSVSHEKNKYFVVHSKGYSNSPTTESGYFEFDSLTNGWTILPGNTIAQGHIDTILTTIQSRIKKPLAEAKGVL